MTSPTATHSNLQECRTYLNAAERLIRTAARAVCSFFVQTSGDPPFIGFLRDSLVTKEALKPSTGGLAVAASLFEIAPELCYVHSSTDTSTDTLKQCRDMSRDFYVDLARKIPIREAFGPFNALTFSVAAYLSAAQLPVAQWTARTAFFNAMNLDYFLKKNWPLLENVDKAHPYVAYGVLRAALEFESQVRCQKLLDFLKDQELVEAANVDIQGPSPDGIKQKFGELTEILTKGERIETLWKNAVINFEEKAAQYLWGQTSYAPRQNGSKLDSLEYDPVGSCFALNILERCAVVLHKGSAVQYLLGARGTLIQRSIQNILEATSASGALPNGVPFSYNPRGMGAFVTSVSGLAALARFLCRLLQNARRNGYPSSDVLVRLFSENTSTFHNLFALAAVFDSSPRYCDITTNPDLGIIDGKKLYGWWTDRAPSDKQVGSWITIEVFLFAVYLREVIQEFAQLLVLRKYGGVWPSSEPAWPYDPDIDFRRGAPVKIDSGNYLRDPDEGEVGKLLDDPDSPDAPPVVFLHQSFRNFMISGKDEASPEWQQEVSSVLLFGPPGTAKTTTIKSLAQKLGWHFLELTPSNFIIDGMELIEQRAKDIFDDLNLLRETVILFDELDSIFIDRELLESGNIVNFLVPAMLPKLQALAHRAKRQRLLIAIATNFYDRLDPAVVRRGRIDKHLLVLPYNHSARVRFIKDYCKVEKLQPMFEQQIREQTALYVFEELKQLAALAKSGGWYSGSSKPPDKFPPAAIGPMLYMSRIPKDATQDLTHIRSTQRLAVEVCGVVQRLKEKPRALHNDGVQNLISHLASLQKYLTKTEKELGWQSLCQRLLTALKAAQTSERPRTRAKRQKSGRRSLKKKSLRR